MRRCRSVIPSVFVSLALLTGLAPRVAADEEVPLRGAGELVADSDATRQRLLTTELAVARELFGMVRSRVVEESEMQKSSAEYAARVALLAIERMQAALQILKQLDSGTSIPLWLQQEELSLQVLLAARVVDEGQDQLRDAKLQTRRELLSAISSLLSRQLALANVGGGESAESSKISQQWLDVERRVKSLNDRFEVEIASRQASRIQQLSVEAQELIEQSQPLVLAAWELCKDKLPGPRDDSAIRSHIDAIRSQSDGVLAVIDAAIAKTSPSEPGAAKLRSLQIKKLATLRAHLLYTERVVREGFLDRAYRDYLQALDENFSAEFDLCQSKDERIARCRQHIRRLEDTLRFTEAEYRAKVRSRYEVDRTKIQLVNAEILLAREQSSD